MVEQLPQPVDQIRVNIAFEQMVVSVLTGAFVGGALTFLLNVAGVFLDGFSFAALLTAILQTLLVAFVIFLVGFFSSVVIGAPLFVALEKRKRRNVWPYLAAAIAVAIISFAAAVRGLPEARDFTLATCAAIFVPTLVFALMFARGMRPHWQAAELAEAEAQASASGPYLYRVH